MGRHHNDSFQSIGHLMGGNPKTDHSVDEAPHIEVSALTMAYGEFIIQQNLSFKVRQGDTFIIMGGSGCGKSTLLRHLIGLKRPARGEVRYHGQSFWSLDSLDRQKLTRRMGVLYQSGALWTNMTLAENVALPLQVYTQLSASEIRELASFKLSLVGLKGFEDYAPSEVSGGMQKRAGLARAMALDPELLFFDEPSAGLDPISARRLDDLIIELSESLGTTIVVVTHELASIFSIGHDAVFLDFETKTMIAQGNPVELRDHSQNPKVREFLTRGNREGCDHHVIQD
jgi:phospholipid/cholesterol/gamma-HCH transport system ATP-binding protein